MPSRESRTHVLKFLARTLTSYHPNVVLSVRFHLFYVGAVQFLNVLILSNLFNSVR